MSPPAFQRAERMAKRARLVYSFRRLTLRSATGTAQRARPYRGVGRSRMRPPLTQIFQASGNGFRSVFYWWDSGRRLNLRKAG